MGLPPESVEPGTGRATYARAGVDIALGDEAVARIKDVVTSTHRPGVLGDIGGFGGLFALDTDRYQHPVLVSSTDGVGTKLLVARATGRYDTIGIDLVAMCVDDLVCVGAEPLFLLDYVAVGKVNPELMEQVVGGVADGCRQAGCALIGGETAEHPGVMAVDDLDIAGFAVGAVERGQELGSERVHRGDVLIGLSSPGIRSNGYTLARHVFFDRAGRGLDEDAWPGADHSLADELLLPSVIYARAVLAAIEVGGIHAVAHITGGGIPGNLNRVMPADCDAVVDAGRWEVPRIFTEISRLGEVAPDEMARVFNMGVGMILVVDRDAAPAIAAAVQTFGHLTTEIGQVEAGRGTVRYA